VLRTVVASAAMIAVLALTGCQGTTSTAPTPVRSTDLTSADGGFDEHAVIGVVLPAASAGATGTGDRYRDALTEAGFRPDVRSATGTDAVASQRDAIRALVRNGAKALLVQAVDASALGDEVQTAHDAGVVVIAIGDPLPATGTGGDGVASDYRVRVGSSDETTVARAVRVVESLQRGEKPGSTD
jgi:ABC-type sugar transport system substrate-binding protein